MERSLHYGRDDVLGRDFNYVKERNENMAKELEVKVLNINKKQLEKKLISIGAKLIKKEHQINTIFDTDNDGQEETEKGYLRIREGKDLTSNEVEYIFTFKSNLSIDGLRENKEIETKVSDKDALIEILKILDINIKSEGTKERISYEYDGIRFDIDTWDKETYPYPYLEIEVTKKEDLEKAIKLLEIDEKDITLKSLKQLRESVIPSMVEES